MSRSPTVTKIALVAITLFWSCRGEAHARQWKSKSGNYSVEAEFIKLSGSRVRLRKANGREISVPINKLSDADVFYIASRIGASAEEGDEPQQLAAPANDTVQPQPPLRDDLSSVTPAEENPKPRTADDVSQQFSKDPSLLTAPTSIAPAHAESAVAQTTAGAVPTELPSPYESVQNEGPVADHTASEVTQPPQLSPLRIRIVADEFEIDMPPNAKVAGDDVFPTIRQGEKLRMTIAPAREHDLADFKQRFALQENFITSQEVLVEDENAVAYRITLPTLGGEASVYMVVVSIGEQKYTCTDISLDDLYRQEKLTSRDIKLLVQCARTLRRVDRSLQKPIAVDLRELR